MPRNRQEKNMWRYRLCHNPTDATAPHPHAIFTLFTLFTHTRRRKKCQKNVVETNGGLRALTLPKEMEMLGCTGPPVPPPIPPMPLRLFRTDQSDCGISDAATTHTYQYGALPYIRGIVSYYLILYGLCSLLYSITT